jgi:DUF4097 and DUF4098 domain-containing protein YvlB
MRALLGLCVLSLLALPGCIQGDFASGPHTTVPTVQLPAQHGVSVGTPSEHAGPQVNAGNIAVSHQGTRWYARQTILVQNAFSGADRVAVSLAAFNGGIKVDGTTDSGYKGTVKLEGSGDSEQAAREALASMELRTPDVLQGTSLTFGLHVLTLTDDLPYDSGRGASIDLKTPRGPIYNLAADTSNGPITLQGLRGESLVADTSNGPIDVSDVQAAELDLDTSNGPITAKGFAATEGTFDTSNGPIDAEGTADDLTLDTSNGPIDATLRPAASGHYTLDSSNGQILLKLKGGADTGFDATASTSNGRATVSLTGGEDVGIQEDTDAHARSAGYSGKAIQTRVQADSSNADVRVTQA